MIVAQAQRFPARDVFCPSRRPFAPRVARPVANILIAIAVLVGVIVGAPARAEVVEDIDAARLPVTGRSRGDLVRAQRDGLAEVLVKLSGSRAVLEAPALEAAVANPDRYLRGYSYEEEGDALFLRLEYDGPALRALLQQARQPLWTANRPLVLTWLVYNDGGRRRFASADELPALRDAVSESFARRGLPLQLPLYDLVDVESLTPGEAWRLSSGALVAASARYAPDALLAGRVATLSDGSWVGEWRFLDGTRWLSRQVTTADMAAFVAAGADLVATTFAARYAVVGGAQEDLRYRLRVEGIDSYAAYRALSASIGAVEVVDRVVAESVERDRLYLRVESAATLEQLARLLALDPRLRRLSAAGDAALAYRWGDGS